MRRNLVFILAVVLAAPLGIAACGGGGGGGSTPELTATYVFESNDTPLGIPDFDLGGVASAINVTGVAGSINEVAVQLSISHTWDDDLIITLISPSGTEITLAYWAGLDGNNFNGTIFDDDAVQNIQDGSAPFKGTYAPYEALWNLIGEDPNGTWYLWVVDDYPQDVGTLNWWKIGID